MNALIMVGLGLSLLAPQKSGTDLLTKHVSALQDAKSLSVVFTVQAIPSAPQEYRIDFSRPGMAKIATPKGFVLTDGKTVWEYYKDSNEYAEYPGGLKEIMEHLMQEDIAPWAAFFLKDQFKSVKDATLGKQTIVKGLKVIPVSFTVDANKSKTATFFFDPATGIAQGATFKAARAGDSSEVIILAKEVKLGQTELDNSVFAFEAPLGAKKVEYARHDLEKWYTNLDEALKAAKASNRMVFLDFGTEW